LAVGVDGDSHSQLERPLKNNVKYYFKVGNYFYFENFSFHSIFFVIKKIRYFVLIAALTYNFSFKTLSLNGENFKSLN